jgi:NADPH:quinone reductase-like Zn-dependent oxidoreductase
MRAVRLDGYGDVDVLEVRDVDVPVAAADQVVVQVVATSINPGEASIRSGAMDPERSAAFPMGEGSDFAGRIVDVGAEVTDWETGAEVIGWSDQRSAHAQYVAVPAGQITRRPEQVPWEQAGSLYVAGGTAVTMRDAVSMSSGETVVVTAAAGGVGSILTQLLVRAGARVLGVAGPGNDAWLTSVGAEPVNRGEDLVERLGAAAPGGVAAFFDCFGQGYTDRALELGVPSDKVVTIADFDAAGRNGTRVVFGWKSTTAATLVGLAKMIAAGDLEVPIAATYPLEEVRAAYTALAERRTRGKIVLLP